MSPKKPNWRQRDRPLKTSAFFLDFQHLPPPYRHFFTTIRRQFWPILYLYICRRHLWRTQRIKIAHLFAGRLLRNELPLIMTKSSKSSASVSARDRELLAAREDLLLDLKGDLRLDLEDLEAVVEAASLDDFLDDTKWANLESTDTEVRIRFWNIKEKNCRKLSNFRFRPSIIWSLQKFRIWQHCDQNESKSIGYKDFRAGFYQLIQKRCNVFGWIRKVYS